MPTESESTEATERAGWPEVLLGLLAAVIFLGGLGSVDLWGKREQRASAEVLDTIDHHHWLVAEIQGRPRLEKPPLPRWIVAALIEITGRRNEWIVRLPVAGFAMGTVALVYLLGRRFGGRPLGLASALILSTSGLFVGEMRQAGNDGPLAFFTMMAIHAAWHALHDEVGARRWVRQMALALGLGFLCKGPIVLMLAAAAIFPYLIQMRRLREGLGRLADLPGLLLFLVIAASWPASVALNDPNATDVWMTEMSEKTGLLGLLAHRGHGLLAGYWPLMTFPWPVVAMAGLVVPFLPDVGNENRGAGRPALWYAWWWATANMAIFCFWSVAKPYYYLPCAPAMAILAGAAWLRLSQRAREVEPGRGRTIARVSLQAQWVVLFVGAAIFPIAIRESVHSTIWTWSIVPSAALMVAVAASARAWRAGADATSLTPIAAALGLGVVVVYGVLAPAENPRRGHRDLAGTLQGLAPSGDRTIYFYNEVDEGLWFYARGLELAPVPGTQPRYSTTYDLTAAYQGRQRTDETVELLDARREEMEKQALLRWLDARHAPALVLIRSYLYDRYAGDLAGRARPVLRESGLDRNELVVLQTLDRSPIATAEAPVRR